MKKRKFTKAQTSTGKIAMEYTARFLELIGWTGCSMIEFTRIQSTGKRNTFEIIVTFKGRPPKK